MPSKGKRQIDWGDTRLILPNDSPLVWNNVLAQGQLAAKNDGSEPHIMVDDLFRDFPVAFMTA